MAYMHIGKDFVPPDVPGKVTGRIKYAEDYSRDGMAYVRLLTSPIPHARVASIDASEALAMDGVYGILTAADVYPDGEPSSTGLRLLTNNPTLIGEPILAVAAVDEKTAEDALQRISVTFERLPFVLDPLDSMAPGGPNAYDGGNAFIFQQGFARYEWTADQITAFRNGAEPTAAPQQEWAYGDLAAAFAASAFVYESTFTTAGYPHQCMEPRSAFAYWENGKCFLHGTSQSLSALAEGMAQIVGVPIEDFVFINEATGGGFGQRARPGSIPSMAIPAKMSQKINRPVMMRISREEELLIGGARVGFQGWIKTGFKADGTIAAVDVYIISDNGGKGGGGDASSAADAISMLYQAEAVRFRGAGVGTNTGHRGAQRGPGQNQIAPIMAPIMDKAADELGIDRLEIRKINAVRTGDAHGPQRTLVTGANMPQTIDLAAQLFNYPERIARRGQKNGSKVTGIGIGQGYHDAGRSGMDGILRLAPDGRLKIHSGVGNLGTYSYASTSRVAAEVLKMPWERCDIETGRTDRHVAMTSPQDGSNSIFTNIRAKYGAAQDLLAKMKEIAAMDLGGAPEDYDIDGERVFRTSNTSVGMTYAQVAQRGIELGGKFAGYEYPEGMNAFSKLSVDRLAGSALIGVFNDPRHNGTPAGLNIALMEIELDTETGKYEIKDMVNVADCGTVVHPQGMVNQLRGGATWGIGLTGYERHLYDPQNGLPAVTGYWQSKVPTIMDVSTNQMIHGWLEIPDPENPVGARGVGEPAQGSVAAALASALYDATNGHLFNAVPTTADMILNHYAGTSESAKPLAQNNFRG